jgi:hypothetical protein
MLAAEGSSGSFSKVMIMRHVRVCLVLAIAMAFILPMPGWAAAIGQGVAPRAVPATAMVPPDQEAAGGNYCATLVGIRSAHHPGFDRLVFDFDGPVPTDIRYGWTTELWYDTAGPAMRAHVAGNAYIAIMFSCAWGIDFSHPNRSSYGPTHRAYALPNVTEVLEIGDWEGYLSFGIGVMRKTGIVTAMALLHPTRYVLDITTDFERTSVRDVFFDRDRSGWTTVWREVPVGNVAHDALVRLFAGPTLAERADGIRLITSGTYGFRDLSIASNGVARVTLRGHCDSHGATATIAGEITRTLKLQPNVEWVKIYGPRGHTLHPTGLSDSIPACLAP